MTREDKMPVLVSMLLGVEWCKYGPDAAKATVNSMETTVTGNSLLKLFLVLVLRQARLVWRVSQAAVKAVSALRSIACRCK